MVHPRGSGPYRSYNGASATATPGNVTLGASNVKGSWADLVAATDIPLTDIVVQAMENSVTTRMLLDIGIDPAGGTSFQVLIPNILGVFASGGRANVYQRYPLLIPAGSRIAARAQGDVATPGTVRVVLSGQAPDVNTPKPYSKVDVYGIVEASTAGTSVDPGATVNTYGAWTDLSGVLAQSIKQLWVQVNRGLIASSIWWRGRIGVDPAGGTSFVPVGYEFHAYMNSGTDMIFTPGPELLVNIPAGSRLGVQLMCSSNNATDRTLEVALHAMR